ncbi:MAG TPA: serine/threonine protein kinase [Pyrinomonadaceae bacterium]|nr:serine/threonine protein kinase [Pyrinomonadaceae bacterium]
MKELVLINCRLDRRYDIHDQLGKGSYAEVFLARDTIASPQSPHSEVVIKALNVFLQDDLDADLERTLVENFQNEAVALDRVRHPNIISRIGHGTARDLKGTVFHYLVLEYLSGGDLQAFVRKQQIPLQQALGFIEQICAGLGHAHEKGIIHRDIKPQNLLLTADRSTVKIADFGVARVNLSDSPITRVGTNIYAPPEHSPMFAGQTGNLEYSRLTPAADIYSLAKSAYTLITGEAPRAYAHEPITGLPESVRSEEWAGELLRVFAKATAADPRERHQSVDELWADLAVVRQIAADGEYSTMLRARVEAPQPHVSRGYSPLPPAQPNFEPIPETVAIPPVPDQGRNASVNERAFTDRNASVNERARFAVAGTHADGRVSAQNVPRPIPITAEVPVVPKPVPITAESPIVAKTKKRRTLRRLATFVIIIGIFTGILYGTATYMRGRGLIPDITNPLKTRTAVAKTDIYLRSGPDAGNDQIGLVTKNSKVRIVKEQNNWYQVDVVEQGRARTGDATATRGWLNGKYLELSDN